MTLLDTFLDMLGDLEPVFPQHRTYRIAVRQAVGTLGTLGRHTISRIIWGIGRDQESWSSDYRLFSRSPWNPSDLFQPILARTTAHSHPQHIAIAMDDTRLHKTGRNIKTASYTRDPLSPPFHINLIFGLRFLQASALLPLYREGASAARGVPVRFTEVPVVKKPGKKASEEDHRRYQEQVRENNLSHHAVAMLRDLRAAYDAAGAADKILIAVGDGSFCNRTVLSVNVPQTHWLVRCRKDAVLCQPAFLLTTDLLSPANILIQMYFDRWEIEINHRDEKDLLGVGEAQVRSTQSVPRQPAFVVAAYSTLLLAALSRFGPGRTDVYLPLPKWRRKARRPSLLDLVAIFRKEMVENPHRVESFGIKTSAKTLLTTAAA